MDYQNMFKRYELKYLLSGEQLAAVQDALQLHMQPDPNGKTTVRSLYFDTDSWRLVRRSIEHPVYKEKLRLRCYGQAESDTPVFVELKKKYQHIVYKRRIRLPLDEALGWVCGGYAPSLESQITREIDYFLTYYQTLAPAALITYDREAFLCPNRRQTAIPGAQMYFDVVSREPDPRAGCRQAVIPGAQRSPDGGSKKPESEPGSQQASIPGTQRCPDGSSRKPDPRPDSKASGDRGGGDLRITFDSRVLARFHDLSLASGVHGTPLLPEDRTIMEIKTAGGMPLWLVRLLSENHIYKTTYSKYGTAYQTLLQPAQKGGTACAE